ncbi:MAG: carbon starvation CstA family protein [Brevinema sp.]
MTIFFIGVGVLILGYFIYGSFVEKILQPTDNPTPAVVSADGVDFVQLPLWRIVLIQFLNIAGLGPIYGPITGALFGPSAFLWIAFGCIFAGGVHDFIVGMTSIRNNGISIGELVGKYLGPIPLYAMRIFSLILLMLLAVIFAKGPASMLQNLISGFVDLPSWFSVNIFFYIILGYYFLAAFLPIDKIIAPLYPILGALLILTAIALLFQLVRGGYQIPFEGFTNQHPQALPIFPFLFLTIACGACSGFHATQTPMMARCVVNEKQARLGFYGAMILEGIIAMIWAAVPMAFFSQGSASATAVTMLENGALNNPGLVVNTAALALLGSFGGVLAVIGVIVCPITSGDTCFRSMRLAVADNFHLNQRSIKNRLVILVPLMILGIMLNFVDFNLLWRYFAFSNQSLAAFALWMGTGYLATTPNGIKKHWVSSVPAAFMTSVCLTYILTDPLGFRLPYELSVNLGVGFGFLSLIIAHILVLKKQQTLYPIHS